MNRFVPALSTTFQPMAFYTPQPMMVAAKTRPYGALALGATEFGAAKKKDDKKAKGKKKGKKKESGLKNFLKTSAKAAGALAKEGGADLLKKKTGIDLTTPSEGGAGVDAGVSSGESYDAGSEGSGGEETKKSNTPLIVGGVLAALLLAGGGFYLYTKKKKAGGSPAPAPAAAV